MLLDKGLDRWPTNRPCGQVTTSIRSVLPEGPVLFQRTSRTARAETVVPATPARCRRDRPDQNAGRSSRLSQERSVVPETDLPAEILPAGRLWFRPCDWDRW